MALRLLLVLLLGLSARAQEPATLAVLPLGKAAASEQYDGLGRALAGMLVTDFSTTPLLRLVERDRLDAVLSEIELGEGGFVDPRSAQKLGKGLGAAYVLTGSFSVVGETFLLDARIVDVGTGEIVKAADTHGAVADFVAVEKELVDVLLAGLNVSLSSTERRKLMVQAPTEAFGAFAAFGEGLAREDEGKLEEARKAFEMALAADPTFAEARAALEGLGAMVATARAEQKAAAKGIADASHAKVLAEVPDERARAADHIDTADTVAAWVLRIGVLEDEGMDCERYAEMAHYLDRVGWKIVEPRSDSGVMSYKAGKLATAFGLDRVETRYDRPEHLKDSESSRGAALFRGPLQFVFREQTHNWRKRSNGMFGSMQACFAPDELLAGIDALTARARKAGAATVSAGNQAPYITMEEHLVLWWCRTQAKHLGASRELTRRTEALLAGRKDDPVASRQMIQWIDDIVKLAAEWEDSRARRLGRPVDEIVAVMRAYATADATVLVTDTPYCAAALQQGQSRAVSWVARFDEMAAKGDDYRFHDVDRAGADYGILRDLGCVRGTRGRFTDYPAAYAYVSTTRARVHPQNGASASCISALSILDSVAVNHAPAMANPSYGPIYAIGALQSYYGLVQQRCVVEPL